MSSASSSSSSSGCNFRVGDRVHLLVEVRECKTQANLLVVHVKRSRKKRFAWTLKLDKYDDETWEKDADECVLQKLNQEPEVVHWTKPDPAPLPKQKKME